MYMNKLIKSPGPCSLWAKGLYEEEKRVSKMKSFLFFEWDTWETEKVETEDWFELGMVTQEEFYPEIEIVSYNLITIYLNEGASKRSLLKDFYDQLEYNKKKTSRRLVKLLDLYRSIDEKSMEPVDKIHKLRLVLKNKMRTNYHRYYFTSDEDFERLKNELAEVNCQLNYDRYKD